MLGLAWQRRTQGDFTSQNREADAKLTTLGFQSAMLPLPSLGGDNNNVLISAMETPLRVLAVLPHATQIALLKQRKTEFSVSSQMLLARNLCDTKFTLMTILTAF